MKELRCPGCGRVFSIDKADFDSIAEQVKGLAIDEQVAERVEELREKLSKEFEIVRLKTQERHEKNLAGEAQKLREKEQEILLLKQQLSTLADSVKLREEAENAKQLRAMNEQHAKKENELSLALATLRQEMQDALAEKDKLIASLQSAADNDLNLRKIAVMEEQRKAAESIKEKDEEIARLNNAVEAGKREAASALASLKEQHSMVLAEKMKEIEYYKDFKLRMSTKLIGESLEVHCNTLFNQARSLGLFPNASFSKDNLAVEGTKGDFIFRDYIDGEEYVSIMFEMKNEADTTSTKHKNIDFLDKLHKDREKKNCEYAVLVSMLERDNELYNDGIVNVSHIHPNMYVIRPQMFMPLIALLCQASRRNTLKIVELQRELEEAREQSLDISKFERRRNEFTKSFCNYVEKHSQKVQSANDGIDKIIESLERQIKQLREVKAMFSESGKKMESAQTLLQSKFTIKSLTHGAPRLRAQFEEARKTEETDEEQNTEEE